MMNSSPFRSHIMQQFAANARTQSRPPLALFSFVGERGREGQAGYRRVSQQSSHRPLTLSATISGHNVSPSNNSSLTQRRPSSSVANSTSDLDDGDSSADAPSDIKQHHLSSPAQKFQQLIASRRTITNFVTHPSSEQASDRQFLKDAIARGVSCAATAPNHKITEPTTFHRILSPSTASEILLGIAYEVTLRRLLDNKLSGEEACRSEATRKREKWAKIPAFVVATVSGMEDQSSAAPDDGGSYKELPYVPPKTIRQLEDYASACASIQNLLLSLHSEGLGSKWATGPVIRTRAFRDLVRCREQDMVVGLLMVGWPKRLPKMRRRRELDGDVLRDVL